MDDVRLELADDLGHMGLMPPEHGVVAQTFVEAERERSAGELDVSGAVVVSLAGLLGASDAEEGILSLPRELGKLAAGQRYAVDLVERVREEGDARNGRH
jgi:hypothetical protein